MPRQRRGYRVSGSSVGARRSITKLCAGCEGFVRPTDTQCPACGRLDTITFDSYAEAVRYGELRLLEKAGQITDLVCQPRFDLLVKEAKIGAYVGDFRYTENGKTVIEDLKGQRKGEYVETDLSAWKRKHLRAQTGIEVKIIAR